MDVATSLPQIYDKLLELGWEAGVKLQGGEYVASARNKTTQQSIERRGESPELALAAVYKHAVRAYELRRRVFARVFRA